METTLSTPNLELFFERTYTQAQKIELMEEIFNGSHQYSNEQLTGLIQAAIVHKDIHVLGYCLALDDDENPIFNKEELFFLCIKENFEQGMQLVASTVEPTKKFDCSIHPESSQPLFNHAFTYAIELEEPRRIMNFLINRGGNCHFDQHVVLRHSYENFYMPALEYFIKEQNIEFSLLESLLKDDTNVQRKQTIENIYKDHQYQLTQNVFVMKELSPTVTRRKI